MREPIQPIPSKNVTYRSGQGSSSNPAADTREKRILEYADDDAANKVARISTGGPSDERREGPSDERREGPSDERREGPSDERREGGPSDERREGPSDERREGGPSTDRCYKMFCDNCVTFAETVSQPFTSRTSNGYRMISVKQVIQERQKGTIIEPYQRDNAFWRFLKSKGTQIVSSKLPIPFLLFPLHDRHRPQHNDAVLLDTVFNTYKRVDHRLWSQWIDGSYQIFVISVGGLPPHTSVVLINHIMNQYSTIGQGMMYYGHEWFKKLKVACPDHFGQKARFAKLTSPDQSLVYDETLKIQLVFTQGAEASSVMNNIRTFVDEYCDRMMEKIHLAQQVGRSILSNDGRNYYNYDMKTGIANIFCMFLQNGNCSKQMIDLVKKEVTVTPKTYELLRRFLENPTERRQDCLIGVSALDALLKNE